MRTAVVIHAQFLPFEVWESVMWGNPRKGVFGVIPTALRLAHQEKAEFIYWCSGIPHKGGRAISPDALEYAINRAGELPEYAHLHKHELMTMLKTNALFDSESQTTREEMERAALALQKCGTKRVFLVSPPKHIFRVHQEALRLNDLFKDIQVFPLASYVDFPDATAADVAIIEPGHRGDQPKWQTHRYAQASFMIMKMGEAKFGRYLTEWGLLLENYGVEVNWKPKL